MSYDQWLTTFPEPVEMPLPGDPGYPRCACGAFLKLDPDQRVPGWLEEQVDGRMVVTAAWEVAHRVCKRCGKDNEEVIP